MHVPVNSFAPVGTDPQWNPKFTPGTTYYSHYGTVLGTLTKLG